MLWEGSAIHFCLYGKECSIGFLPRALTKRQWCSGNMKPFQGLAGGSIPPWRILFTSIYKISQNITSYVALTSFIETTKKRDVY